MKAIFAAKQKDFIFALFRFFCDVLDGVSVFVVNNYADNKMNFRGIYRYVGIDGYKLTKDVADDNSWFIETW